MGEKVMFLCVLMVMIFCGGCNGGNVYKVGGSSGWTNINIASCHFKSWASSKVFHVGDTLWFEYNKEFHNVARVTHKDYKSCNSTAPYSTWATGNDSFTITKPGHFYFICGLPGHCWAGQKVDVRVHKCRHGPSPSPSPSASYPPSPAPSPPSPSPAPAPAPAPAPSAHKKKSGSSSLGPVWKLWLLVAAISLWAIVC